MTGLFAALAIWTAVVLICAALTRPDSSARPWAILVALAGLPAAFLVPAEAVFARFLVALLLALALGRTLDLALRPHALDLLARVWMLVAFFDVRQARRGPPGLDPRELSWLLPHLGLVFVGGLGVLCGAPRFDGLAHWLVRWSSGLLLCYGLVESIHSILLMSHRALGVHHVRINLWPIVSTTLVEFWGRRWNRVVATWLRDYAFFPLARRGRARLGIAAAFVVSGVLHLWVSWVPLGGWAGLIMASFFVVHGLALMIERGLDVPRWPVGLRRTWTIAVLVSTSPLFVEPMLQILVALASW